MAANLQWLKDRGIPVIYTPFVESDDRNKWHAKQGSEVIIRLYRLVHDYFQLTKKLDNIVWAYHTTQNHGALERCYPGDDYVDVLGKSAYGTGLVFSEYEWAVAKKKQHGKVIWWAEVGIRGKSDPPRDCFDVLQKLESHCPELAGFVFWSDEGLYNVVGNLNGKEFVLVSLLMFMLNNRMVVAGPLYQNDKTGSVWAEVGAAAMTEPLDSGVGEGELDGAKRLGERVARLALKLKRAETNVEVKQ